MPKLPLPENCLEDPVMAHLAGIIITSTMLYPSDEEKRRDMQTVMKANTVIKYKNSNYVPEGISPEDAKHVRDEFLHKTLLPAFSFEGYWEEKLLNLDSFSHYTATLTADSKTGQSWRTLYCIVLLLHQIHNSDYNRRSSFNVVYSIIEKYKKEQKKKFIGNNKDLKKLWASHRSIAALSVPYAFVANDLADKEKFSFYEIEGLRYFLAVAVSVENFLTSHGNKYGVKSSFIQRDELWYVPEELNIRPEELILPLLSVEDVNELISYKPS